MCFAVDGPEYMGCERATVSIIHSDGARKFAAGEGNSFGCISDEAEEDFESRRIVRSEERAAMMEIRNTSIKGASEEPRKPTWQ